MIYEFIDYKAYLRAYIKSKPKSGRGILSKLAASMNITSAQLSHVMKGGRDFSPEQALKAAHFIGLTKTETLFFMELVAFARAGTRDFKEFSKARLEELRAEGLQLKNQVPAHQALNDEERARFYSSWIFSAVRLYCSIKPRQIEDIATFFSIDKKRVVAIVDFLLRVGLCRQAALGYEMGPQTTFVPRDSPFVHKHHSNWRLKALEQSDQNNERDLFFTSPVSLSKKDFENLKVKLTELIKEFSAVVKDSPAEEVACLNIDFFVLRR